MGARKRTFVIRKMLGESLCASTHLECAWFDWTHAFRSIREAGSLYVKERADPTSKQLPHCSKCRMSTLPVIPLDWHHPCEPTGTSDEGDVHELMLE